MKTTANPEVMRDLASKLARGEDVLCLHALAQPLVSEMQDVIRFQRAQLDECSQAFHYFLRRVQEEPALQSPMIATEALARIVRATAAIVGQTRKAIGAQYDIPVFGDDEEEADEK